MNTLGCKLCKQQSFHTNFYAYIVIMAFCDTVTVSDHSVTTAKIFIA